MRSADPFAIAHAFYDHHELHGRFRKLHGGLRVLKLGAVDDVRPLDQLLKPAGVEAEMLLEHLHDEFGAGTVGRIVEFPAAPVGPEMSFVLPAEECALVMVEPPGQARIAGIFEIHDGIFIPVELHVQEKLASAVGQSLVLKFAIPADCAADKNC